MKDLLLALLHVAVMTAKACGPGGVRAVIAENLLLKQQLIVLRGGLTTNSRRTGTVSVGLGSVRNWRAFLTKVMFDACTRERLFSVWQNN
jgi:hypothetical protein